MTFQRKRIEAEIRIDGEVVDWLSLLTVRRSLGARSPDTAEFVVDLPRRDGVLSEQSPIVDWSIEPGGQRTVEVTLLGDEQVIHYGMLGPIGLQPSSQTWTSIAHDTLFGKPFTELHVLDSAGVQTIPPQGIVANPTIAGVVRGNRTADRKGDNGEYLWLLDGSSRTESATGLVGDLAAEWTLPDLLHYFFATLNADQLHYNNPSLESLQQVVDDDDQTLKNQGVPFGRYLPQILDHLLVPRGYTWWIDYQQRGLREIKVQKRSRPETQGEFGGQILRSIELKMQRPGEVVDLDQTNVPNFNLAVDPTRLFNVVHCFGAPMEVEVSVELTRGWPESDDEIDYVSLADSPENLAYRLWVWNEAGDYKDTGRSEHQAATDLSQYFDPANLLSDSVDGVPQGVGVIRRRRFLPPLTTYPDGTRYSIQVDFQDSQHEDWTPARSEWVIHVLSEECGLYFPYHHHDILEEGADFKLRVTATVQSDMRLEYRTERDPTSIFSEDIVLPLDVSDRFFYRSLHSSSKNFEIVQNGGRPSLARNDASRIEDFAKAVLDTTDLATVTGPVTVFGLSQPELLPGVAVTKIAGREISLNCRSNQNNRPAYPVVESLTYDYRQERITVSLQTQVNIDA